MNAIKIVLSNILTAFTTTTIGSKVVQPAAFMAVLNQAVAKFDFASQKVPGQGFIPLLSGISYVSAGVGRRTTNPEDYVLRTNRGRVNAYLRREEAAPVESLAVIVYTAEAYAADPEADPAEISRVTAEGATHVLVAVLASAGPKAPLTPIRLLANLAGGNKEALVWDADTIRAKAKDVVAYDETWSVVAD